jgi:hypothetical protein
MEDYLRSMKKTFSKILAVAVTVAVLAMLVIGIVPVSASSVSQPQVIVAPGTVSAAAKYTIDFDIGSLGSIAATTGTITVQFPVGTTVPTGAMIGVTVASQTGPLPMAPGPVPPADPTYTTYALTSVVGNANTREVTITLGAVGITGAAHVEVAFAAAAGIINPGTASTTYTLSVKTSTDTTYIASATYAIISLTNIQIYNKDGVLVGTPNNLYDASFAVGKYYTVKLGAGAFPTYDATTLAGMAPIASDYVTITTMTGNAGPTIIPSVPAAPFRINGSNDSLSNVTLIGGVFIGSALTGDHLSVTNCAFIKTPYATGVNQTPETLLTVGGTATYLSLTNSSFDTTSTQPATQDTAILLGANNATISNVSFKVDQDASYTPDKAISAGIANALLVTGCTFTGAGGWGYSSDNALAGTLANPNIVTKSTFTSLEKAVNFGTAGGVLNFTGNTVTKSISNSTTTWVGAISISNIPGQLIISGNTVTGNTGYSLQTNTNTGIVVSGNTFSGNTKGFISTGTGNGINAVPGLYAINNFWGDTTGPTNILNPTGKGEAINATGSGLV